MAIIIWIIFGAFVGWFASVIMKTKSRGLIRNIVLGLVGAVVGGWIASLLGIGTVKAFNLEGFLIATGGAMLLIWLLRKL
jgi:uncharacterized membrane protein YeaQ/YmgE (transglycosylase-associated protein family)